jgi:hypothetical protein
MLKNPFRRTAVALLISSASLTLAHAQVTITVSPSFPSDIPNGAPNATLQQSAAFAWQEFIALSWPALAGQRDVADQRQKFGAGGNGSPLVWQTFRYEVHGNGKLGSGPFSNREDCLGHIKERQVAISAYHQWAS